MLLVIQTEGECICHAPEYFRQGTLVIRLESVYLSQNLHRAPRIVNLSANLQARCACLGPNSPSCKFLAPEKEPTLGESLAHTLPNVESWTPN